MVASKPPDRHVLIASSNELQVVKWEKLESEYWVVTEVAEGQCPVLFPAKHLHTEHPVHPDRNQLRAIRRKRNVQDSASVRSLQYHNRLERLRVPNMDRRMYSYFSCRDKSPSRMLLNTRYFKTMALVELLGVLLWTVNDAESAGKVNDLFVARFVDCVVLYLLCWV